MDFSTAVRTCLQKYVAFDGRASRPEYWWFFLFGFLVMLVVGFLAAVTALLPLLLLVLVLLPPSIAAAARRLHDTGRSGWWQLAPVVPNLLSEMAGSGSLLGMLIGLIGLVAGIVLIWWLASRGDPQPNAFGHPPA